MASSADSKQKEIYLSIYFSDQNDIIKAAESIMCEVIFQIETVGTARVLVPRFSPL